jgi:hypothetical protein
LLLTREGMGRTNNFVDTAVGSFNMELTDMRMERGTILLTGDTNP